MTDALVKLLGRLSEHTDAGSIRWTRLDDHAYRASVAGGLVRIVSGRVEIPTAGDEEEYANCYWVTVSDELAQVVEEEEVTDRQPSEYRVADALFKAARRSATNGTSVVNKMLDALERR